MAIDLAIGAQQWCDDMRRDPAGPVADYLRQIADDIETNERILVPRDTLGTFRSIRVDSAEDKDGFVYERVLSKKLTTNVLNSKTGYIRNRGPARKGTRYSRRHRIYKSGVRRAHQFVLKAVWSVTKAPWEVTKAP